VLDTKLYPKNLLYQIVILNAQMPENPDQKFVMHKMGPIYGKNFEIPKNDESKKIAKDPIYHQISLHLFKNEAGYLKSVKSAYLEVKN
jgi:hypothetical protein